MIYNENISKHNETWAQKCITCKHCYTTKDDDETLKCRCRTGCHYKEVKENERKIHA